MSNEEKKAGEIEKRAYSTLTMALPKNIFHQVSNTKDFASLFQHLNMRSMGNTKNIKKSMLKFQIRNFCLLRERL